MVFYSFELGVPYVTLRNAHKDFQKIWFCLMSSKILEDFTCHPKEQDWIWRISVSLNTYEIRIDHFRHYCKLNLFSMFYMKWITWNFFNRFKNQSYFVCLVLKIINVREKLVNTLIVLQILNTWNFLLFLIRFFIYF